MAALNRVGTTVQVAEADPAALSRAATVRAAEAADPVVGATVREAEAGLAVVEAIVRAVVADPVVVESTAQVAEADPVEGRADSAEAGRATTAAERFAASALTRSNILTTRT